MAQRKVVGRMVFLLGLLMAGLCGSLGSLGRLEAADQPSGPKPIDILFLVDNSHSINRFDPFNLRSDLIKALERFYADGKDRFAVADFSQDKVDFQSFKPEDWDKLINQKLGRTTGFTSDPNEALNGPLKASAARGGANPLWVVIITDGDINVYDQANTGKGYIDAAFKAYPREQVLADPGLINTEALKQLTMTDKLNQFFSLKATYTPVVFQDKAGAFYQALSGSAAARTPPVVLSEFPLQDLFLGVVRARPDGSPPPSVFAYAAKKLDGGAKTTDKIQLPEGHKHSRIVFFGIGEKFQLRLTQGGKEVAATAKDSGADQYAILNLEQIPAGEYDLEIANAGRGRQLIAEYALFLSIDAAAEITALPRTSISELPFNIALRNSAKKTLTDPAVLKDLKATITLSKADKPGDKTASKEYTLSALKESIADEALPVVTDADAGEYIATVRFQAMKLKGGAYGLDLSAETKIQLAPVLEVNFTHDPKTAHFVNESAGLVAVIKKPLAGKPTDEKQTITLVNKQGGEPAKVVLAKNSKDGSYAGSFQVDRAGEWTIKSEFSEKLAIGPGNNPVFMATPFSLTAKTPVNKQIYVQEAFTPVFVADNFKKLSGKDPENTMALTLEPVPTSGAAAAPAGATAKPVIMQLTLDKAGYDKDGRVKYDLTAGNRVAEPGKYTIKADYVGNTYKLTAAIDLEVLPRVFTLAAKKSDGSWAPAGETAPYALTLKIPWNESWPASPADQKHWVEDQFNNQVNLKASVSLGMHAPGEPEKATLTLVPVDNSYSKPAQEAGVNREDVYHFLPVDGKNVVAGAGSDPYAAPQSGELLFNLQPNKAIKFDGPLCTFAAKISVDGHELAQQPKIELTLETPDKAWKQFMELLPYIIIVVVVLALIIWWVSIPRFKEHQIRPLRKGQPLNTVHMLVTMKVGATGREANAAPEAPNCIRFRRINAATTKIQPINDKVFVFIGNDKITDWREVKHGDELVVDGAGVFQRYRYFERQPTEAELKAAGASAMDEDGDIIVEGL